VDIENTCSAHIPRDDKSQPKYLVKIKIYQRRVSVIIITIINYLCM
jgi:hypothetical protein